MQSTPCRACAALLKFKESRYPTMKRLSIAVLTVLAGSSSASQWAVEKTASEGDDGWAVACRAYPVVHETSGLPSSSLSIFFSTDTIVLQETRGAPDVMKPMLIISARSNRGQSRPNETPLISVECPYNEDTGTPVCDKLDFHEYRMRYRIDANSPQDAWVQSVVVEAPYVWAPGAHWLEEDALLESALSYWYDWPEELFTTDDWRSVKLRFGGMGRIYPDDERRPQLHHMALRFTYAYGADTMATFNQCVEDHIRFGRLARPESMEEAETGLLQAIQRWSFPPMQ